MKKLIIKSAFFVALGTIFFACSTPKMNENTSSKKSVIKSPFKGIDVQADYFSLNASEENQIRTKEGTTITIPANTLVNKDGKVVKGKVKLNYRSIDTPGEIIASGIPMTYDSAGVKNDFISAGMFEIGATQKGEELFIAEGKSINVDFASYKAGDDFSFYQINPENGKWSYKGITKPKVNKIKMEKLQKFKDDNLIQLDIDYSVNKELKVFDKLKWICIDENEKNNPIKNKWILEENWFDISLKTLDEANGIYEMHLSSPKKKVTFKVSPYLLEGENVADMNSKINTLNQQVKDKKTEEERIQMETDINRNFSISSFGTYNWDKIEKQVAEGLLAVTNAAFEIDSKELDKSISIFHFSGKDKLLSRITQKWDKMVYNPNEVNKVLVVLPDNYVAISNSEEFKNVQGKANFLFHLKKRSQKIKSIAELDNLLAAK